ncbi:MAG: NusG domain II-containing protein [Parasporobacterium sp.]|nr:NusG domain II-containing protein [Parasporobacterium sp.]
MKKGDIIIIISVLAAAAVLFCVLKFGLNKGSVAEVLDNGNVIMTFSLSEDIEFEFFSVDGCNTLQIKDGKASIKAADCPDQICVNHTPVNKTGETIVCLPHKLVIRIAGSADSEIDGILN